MHRPRIQPVLCAPEMIDEEAGETGDRKPEDGFAVAEIRAAVEDATDYAEAQPDPDPATATRYVYADPPDGPNSAGGPG